jgi:hypothetical protein
MEPLLLALVFVETVALAAMAIALLRLWRVQSRLRAEQEALVGKIAAQTDDLSGLCAAAVSLDKRVQRHEQRLGELHGWLEDRKTEERLNQPYHLPIDLIRRGADASRLVAECGISREEANLLLRLHGGTDGERRV